MARPHGWVTSDGTVVIKQETRLPRVIHMGTITAEVQQTCAVCLQPFYPRDGHQCGTVIVNPVNQ
jgi:hypothetical protein